MNALCSVKESERRKPSPPPPDLPQRNRFDFLHADISTLLWKMHQHRRDKNHDEAQHQSKGKLDHASTQTNNEAEFADIQAQSARIIAQQQLGWVSADMDESERLPDRSVVSFAATATAAVTNSASAVSGSTVSSQSSETRASVSAPSTTSSHSSSAANPIGAFSFASAAALPRPPSPPTPAPFISASLVHDPLAASLQHATSEQESVGPQLQAPIGPPLLSTSHISLPSAALFASNASSHSSIPEFLFQLTKMLTDDNREVIEWSKGMIEVHNPHRLESEVLQKYFRHSKFASFQRQLNYFGFRKLAGKGKMAPCSYVNESATGDLGSLLFIKRKTTTPTTSKDKATTTNKRDASGISPDLKSVAEPASGDSSVIVNPILAGILQQATQSTAMLTSSANTTMDPPPLRISAPASVAGIRAQTATVTSITTMRMESADANPFDSDAASRRLTPSTGVPQYAALAQSAVGRGIRHSLKRPPQQSQISSPGSLVPSPLTPNPMAAVAAHAQPSYSTFTAQDDRAEISGIPSLPIAGLPGVTHSSIQQSLRQLVEERKEAIPSVAEAASLFELATNYRNTLNEFASYYRDDEPTPLSQLQQPYSSASLFHSDASLVDLAMMSNFDDNDQGTGIDGSEAFALSFVDFPHPELDSSGGSALQPLTNTSSQEGDDSNKGVDSSQGARTFDDNNEF